MTWVRRQQPRHECAPPVTGSIPAIGAAGNIGDLWRCDGCGRLWRVADADEGHRGRMVHGKAWRQATLWQRLRYADATGPDRAAPGVPREPQTAPETPIPQIPGPHPYASIDGRHLGKRRGDEWWVKPPYEPWQRVPDPGLKFMNPAPKRPWRRTA